MGLIRRTNLQLLRSIRHSLRGCLTPHILSLLIATVAPVAVTTLLRGQTTAGIPIQTQSAVSGPSVGASLLTLNARLVELDVVVTDKTGKPVDGLTAKDFQVFEDGKQQRIRSLETPSAHALPATSDGRGASAVFDAAQPASFGRSPVNILILDQLNTHFADSSFARRCLHDYLASQPALLPEPTTLLSIYDNHFKLLQSFTRDRDALLRALAAAPAEYAWKLEVNGRTEYGPVERLDQSLRALEEISQSYARVPGRKNLIWVGGGFPTIDPATIDRGDAQEVKDTLQHVTDVLQNTHITLYAIDPSSSSAGVTEITDSVQLEFAEATGDALSGNNDPFGASDDFDRLGPLTGGRVIRGKNDIVRQIAASVDLGANYYTLSYTPSSSSKAAAQFRKIRVVCLLPGLTATTRSGYYSGQTQQEKSAASAAYDLTTAAESPVPLNGLRVSVESNPTTGASANEYIVRVGVDGLNWKPQESGGATASVYIMAVSLNAKDKLLGHTLHPMKANAKPGVDLQDPTKMASFAFTAAPSHGCTTLRFIVRDSVTGRMGSVDLPFPRH